MIDETYTTGTVAMVSLPYIHLPESAQRLIAEKYGVLVDALYAGRTEQYIETQVKFEDGRTGSVSATLKISDAKTFTPVKTAA